MGKTSCKCHDNYDSGHEWWRCPVHDRVNREEYEDEYEVPAPKEKVPAKKAPPKGTAAAKKARPEPAGKKAKPEAEEVEDESDGDDLGAPPDKEKGEESGPPTDTRSKGFGWG